MRLGQIFPVIGIVTLLAACAPHGEARQEGSVASAVKQSSSQKSVGLKRFLPKSVQSSQAWVPPVTASEDLKIPILVYHHVRPQQGWAKSTWSWKMTVTAATFEKQMQWIVDHGYTTIDLNTYVAIRNGSVSAPAKPIVITFDDNNPNQYTAAWPVLKNKGLTAVFYIITGRIGEGTLTKEQIKELSDGGMDIESHTVTHRVMPALSKSQIDAELLDSKKTLEDITGKPVRHMAYPGTSHNATVRERVAAAGYLTGTIMDPRTSTMKDDLMKLPRIMMTDDTNLEKVLP